MAILLIEDDEDLGKLLSQYLGNNNLETIHTTTGSEAILLVGKSSFELFIIDIMLPDINGFDLVKKVKSLQQDVPFIFLTAKNKNEDIIRGLKLGAEDYITKPFEPEELLLRINIVLRRINTEIKKELELGKSVLLSDDFKFCTPKKEYKLTQKETELLSYIIQNKNRLLKRDQMLTSVWGESNYFIGRSMDVFISRFRKFFCDDPSVSVETFRGIGYIFRDV